MRKRGVMLCLLLLGLGGPAYGQTGLGTITGQVLDTSGGSVPGASIEATNIATGVKTGTVSNDIGQYQIRNVMPGKYALAVSMPGFRTLQREGVVVQVGDVITLDLTLEVGEVSDQITVTDAVPLLRTGDAQTGEVISNTFIQSLPQVDRDPLGLVKYAGNVQGGSNRADSKGSDLRINGGRNQSIDYLVDGISALTGRGHSVGEMVPTTEGIQEFKVVTNPVSAEYGRVSGGVVEVATSSGSNRLRGQVFDYIKNDILNARNWYQFGAPKAAFNQNNFGAAIGGPVWIPKIFDGRNKTFFFFSYDGQRKVTKGNVRTGGVPTMAERQGDLSGSFVGSNTPMIYDPDTSIPLAWDPNYNNGQGEWYRPQLVGDGVHIPANRIHPVSLALLKLFPEPNHPNGPNSSSHGNYQGKAGGFNDHDLWSVRLDHQISENQSIYGRFNHADRGWGSDNWFGAAGTANQNVVDNGYGLTLNYLWTLSPTMVFTARAGGHYSPYGGGNLPDSSWDGSSVWTNPTMLNSMAATDRVNVTLDWGAAVNDIGGTSANYSASTAAEGAVGLTKMMSKHTLKVGFEHRRWYDNRLNGSSGDMTFMGLNTLKYRINPGGNQDAANVFGSFLLGRMVYANLSGYTTRDLAMNYYATYIQDDFKVSPKLTLNLGLRWEMETPVTERFDKLYMWDPDTPPQFDLAAGWGWDAEVAKMATQSNFTAADIQAMKDRKPTWANVGFANGSVVVANTPEHPSRLGSKYHPLQFAPRIGAAYSLGPKTVLRGSFAKMYLSTTGDPNGYAPPNGFSEGDGAHMNAGWSECSFCSERGLKEWSYFTQTWDTPWTVPIDFSSYERTTQFANRLMGTKDSLGPVSTTTHQPYEYTWYLGIQHELPSNLVVEVSYQANRGVGLLGRELINHIPRDILVGGPSGDSAKRWTSLPPNPFLPEQVSYGFPTDKKLTWGRLLMPYPYYTAVAVSGLNVGRSIYQSLNLRTEKRFGQGLSLLGNYTLSNMKDDVGGPGNMDGDGKTYTGGGKWVQSAQSAREVYGTSLWDERHVLKLVFSYDLPFGRNRSFLGDLSNKGFGGKILDYVVGGWTMAGTSTWRSGRPISWVPDTTNAGFGAEVMAPVWADPGDTNIVQGGIQDWNQVFKSQYDARSFNGGILDITKFIKTTDSAGHDHYGYSAFMFGTAGTMYDKVRNPGYTMHNMSLGKRFPIMSQDGSRYAEFRMEARNLFNLRGFAPISVDPRNPQTFGYIMGANPSAEFERHIQMSLRIIF